MGVQIGAKGRTGWTNFRTGTGLRLGYSVFSFVPGCTFIGFTTDNGEFYIFFIFNRNLSYEELIY